MIYDASPEHIQIYVYETMNQVVVGGNCRGEITIFPKGSTSGFPPVIFLGSPAGDQLHAPGYFTPSCILNQQVDMVAGSDIVQHQ